MLEIRLQLLSHVVDKFVLVEATKTFSGYDKPLYYQENKARFAQWEDIIQHHIVDELRPELIEMARESSNTGKGESHWVIEFAQKEALKDALVELDDEDIVFVSDVDEVWNPTILTDYFIDDFVYKPRQNLCYITYLNQRTNEDWTYFTGTIVTRYKNIKNECLNHLRTHSKNTYHFIENGGWHFNALGGVDNKIAAFKHPVYTKEYMQGRQLGLHVDETQLPEYLLQNKEKYKHLWKNAN